VDEGLLGDQTLLKKLNRAAYLFAGENDNTVFNWATKEIKHYYEDNGVKVKFDYDPELGHEYKYKTAAKDIGKWCYDSMGAKVSLKDYKPDSSEFRNDESKGVFKKFDQLELAESLSIKVPEL